jgi:hypothetical protein
MVQRSALLSMAWLVLDLSSPAPNYIYIYIYIYIRPGIVRYIRYMYILIYRWSWTCSPLSTNENARPVRVEIDEGRPYHEAIACS